MAKGFCPMLISIKGETADSDFLPKGNYVDINGKKTPLRHCFTLELPVGECELLICSPPPNTIHRVCTVVRENQMFRLVLTVDCARNIIDAVFGMEDVTEDPFGLYEIECRRAVGNREEIRRWQDGGGVLPQPKPAAPSSKPASSGGSKGGKLVGWGIALTLFFAVGIILCLTGHMEIEVLTITEGFALSNLGIYIAGAVIGVISLVTGLIARHSD